MKRRPTGTEQYGANMVPWRRSRLRHAGFGAQLARDVAADLRYDLPSLLELTERAARRQLAVRILAPLDERDRT